MLAEGFIFIQRDWLSSNSLLLKGSEQTVLIDSGYVTQAEMLAEIVKLHLDNQPLDTLFNTHLHSDHCGGNHKLQSMFPSIDIWIPASQLETVKTWNETELSFQMTGQSCPKFISFSGLSPGDNVNLLGWEWHVHAAPGHDNESLIFFQPDQKLLVSADALWQNGVSVVFPEFLGGTGFENVHQTYDLIESLNPAVVIPGHGPLFTDVLQALTMSRKKLENFQKDPVSHARYSAKVLMKFKLMELQRCEFANFVIWCTESKLLTKIHTMFYEKLDLLNWCISILDKLEYRKSIFQHNGFILNI